VVLAERGQFLSSGAGHQRDYPGGHADLNRVEETAGRLEQPPDARRPRDWYWLPTIRPAYTEVTWMWSAFVALRLAAQVVLYRQGDTVLLGWVNSVLDWPALIAVLAGSYIYGLWRLGRLGGPSVDEFISGQAAPWQGQKKGF
jgi:hypothetical protein